MNEIETSMKKFKKVVADQGVRETARQIDLAPGTVSRIARGLVEPTMNSLLKIVEWAKTDHKYKGL